MIRSGNVGSEMKTRFYCPDQRAADKAASRMRDEEALASGRVTREELQHENGGGGLFRGSRILRDRRQRAGDPGGEVSEVSALPKQGQDSDSH